MRLYVKKNLGLGMVSVDIGLVLLGLGVGVDVIGMLARGVRQHARLVSVFSFSVSQSVAVEFIEKVLLALSRIVF